MQEKQPRKRGRPRKLVDKQCTKCQIQKKPKEFYISHNVDLHPDGKFQMCTDCVRSIIDIHNVESVKDMLTQMNRPYLSHLWISSLNESERTDKHAFGCYMKNIMLNYKTLTWKDSIFGEINISQINTEDQDNMSNEHEKMYNKKWMGDYTRSEIEYLETYYAGLDGDFKIVTINHKDYAKKISKASLHMDKCFQNMLAGGAGADKKYKEARETFDTLSKSAQFSESQRGQNDVSLGCFGVTFDQVEQKKWIPKHIPLESDAIDKLIEQFSSIKESV